LASREVQGNFDIGIDYDGNTLTSVTGSNTTTYAWDFENRLTSVTLPGSGGTVSFKYDPFGRRIYKSSSSGTSIFAYDGNELVAPAALLREVTDRRPCVRLRQCCCGDFAESRRHQIQIQSPEQSSSARRAMPSTWGWG